MTALTTTRRELVACRRVTVSYGSGGSQVVALADVDLTIRAGETMSLWGPSGSGKTTLLHALGGLVAPSFGTVNIQGVPMSSLDAAARARQRARGIAYVFQSPNLLPTFTAYENVAFAVHASGHGGEVDPVRLLTLVGLRAKLDSLPDELSGGEAQRVALARALAQRPALLLCDEPTGHLDSDTGERVLNLIDALHGEVGFALVVATHDADVAARYDRTVALSDGRVVGEESFR
jgi:putative ABC transport system ATP-binding protein